MREQLSVALAACLFLAAGAVNAQDADAEPYSVFWCWSEDDGECDTGQGESFYYGSGDIQYLDTYVNHAEDYYLDMYYVDDWHADIELISAYFYVDREVYTPTGSWIWNTVDSYWVVGDDYTDTDGSVVGFSEWQSSLGENYPNDWDYNTGWYVVLAEFTNEDPWEYDLFIVILDGNLGF